MGVWKKRKGKEGSKSSPFDGLLPTPLHALMRIPQVGRVSLSSSLSGSRSVSTSTLKSPAAKPLKSSPLTTPPPSKRKPPLLPSAVSEEVLVNPVLQKIPKNYPLALCLASLGRFLGSSESCFSWREGSSSFASPARFDALSSSSCRTETWRKPHSERTEADGPDPSLVAGVEDQS